MLAKNPIEQHAIEQAIIIGDLRTQLAELQRKHSTMLTAILSVVTPENNALGHTWLKRQIIKIVGASK